MDTIRLINMQFFAYHGVLPIEAEMGQLFEVDIEVHGDWSKAANSDNLDDAVNYENLYEVTRETVTAKRFNLLEALAETLCTQIFLCTNLIHRVKIAIRKPNAPLKGILDYVEVEIERER